MNFSEFLQKIEYCNPIYVNRNTQGADIFLNGKELGHERTHFPYNIFKPISVSFWINCSFEEKEGIKLAKQFEGEYQEHFYGPKGFGFIIFCQSDPGNEYLEKAFNFLKFLGKIS